MITMVPVSYKKRGTSYDTFNFRRKSNYRIKFKTTKNFTQIGEIIRKHRTTISNEILNHRLNLLWHQDNSEANIFNDITIITTKGKNTCLCPNAVDSTT